MNFHHLHFDHLINLTGPQGPPGVRPLEDDPNVRGVGAPCYEEYAAARKAIDEASRSGKPVIEARLPFCTEDGYYQAKQCLGSMYVLTNNVQSLPHKVKTQYLQI